MKKIYFACSIRAGRDDAVIYRELVDHINTQAYVLSEIFTDGKLSSQGSSGTSGYIYNRDMGWLTESDKFPTSLMPAIH